MCVYMYTDVYTHTRKTKPLSWCFAQYWCACVGGRSAVGWQTKTTNQQTLITHAHKPPIRTHTHTHTLAHKYAVVCDIIFCDVIPYWRFGIWYPPKGSYAKPLPRAVIFIQNRFRSQKRFIPFLVEPGMTSLTFGGSYRHYGTVISLSPKNNVILSLCPYNEEQ